MCICSFQHCMAGFYICIFKFHLNIIKGYVMLLTVNISYYYIPKWIIQLSSALLDIRSINPITQKIAWNLMLAEKCALWCIIQQKLFAQIKKNLHQLFKVLYFISYVIPYRANANEKVKYRLNNGKRLIESYNM